MTRRSRLYGGMRALLACDSGEVVSGIVDFVIAQNRGLRLLSTAVGRTKWLAIPIVLVNGLRCFVGVYLTGSGEAIVAARRPNERKALEHLKRMAPDRRFAELTIGWRPAAIFAALAAEIGTLGSDCRRTARFARRLYRRYGVFRALRMVELLAYYKRYSQLIAGRPFQLAVMSSHSNPHGIALNLAAQRFGIPVVLITHGMPIVPLAKLHYDVAIHECDESKHVYERAGCRMEHSIVKSRRTEHRPMRVPLPAEGLTVGVFLSKDPVEERVLGCVRTLLSDRGVKRVLIRPHPVNLWRELQPCLASLHDPRIILRSVSPVRADVEQCDLIVGGNSTVLLDALVAGRPACYVGQFDHGPVDVQGFVGAGLVYEWSLPSRLDRSAIAEFYNRDVWPRVLRRYADIDRDEEDVAAEVRAALRAVTVLDIGAVA